MESYHSFRDNRITSAAQIMLIDAHSHLDKYNDELDAALNEIERMQILTVSVSMDIESYRRATEIAARSKFIVATFGIHPWNAPIYADRLPELEFELLVRGSPMIGEIGLDFYWVEDKATYPAQVQVCEYFLAAAREQNKIVNLHTKGAEREILDLLIKHKIERAIVHWYSGPIGILREMVARRYYFTVGPEIRYSELIRQIAREIPIDLLLTETDNPGGEKWLGGNLGMPRLVTEVIDAVARLRGLTVGELTQTVSENFSRFAGDLLLPTV